MGGNPGPTRVRQRALMADDVAIMVNAIRVARKARGWSARELSRRAGVTDVYVSLIEAGRRIPTLPMLCTLAGAVDLRVTLVSEETP